MRDIVVSLGRSDDLATVVKTATSSWDKFADFLCREPKETEDKASVGWYCGAHFEPAYRHGKNFVARHLLTFDYDKISVSDLDSIRAAYADYAHVLYTTASHTEQSPRVRLVLPLSRPCDREEFSCVTRHVGDWFDIEKLARESDTPAQLMYLPSKKPGAVFWSEKVAGEWIDVDVLLACYDNWRDRSQWVRRKEGDSTHVSGDAVPLPNTKSGIVGDFCRAFTVPEAIERFGLPYTPGSNDGRWSYTDGSRGDGLRLYDDGLKCHIDNNTDPARGQQNAFDLVRLHLFNDLDTESDEDIAITARPSYKAMIKLALEQPELQAAVASREFENLESGIPETGTNVPKEGKFKLWSLDELMKLPPPEWLVKGLIPRAELIVVFGPPGSGKSFLSYDIGCAVVRGHPWGFTNAKVKQGKVVYVFAEGASGARHRGEAYCRKYGAGSVPLAIIERPNLFGEKDPALLAKKIKDHGGADLIIIDTLNAASPGADENSGRDMTQILDHCRLLHKHTGATVVLVHHSGKDASKGARGWSGLKASADAEIEIARNGDYRTATVSKMKDGLDGVRHSFLLKPITLYMDADGDDVTSCYVEHVETMPDVPAATAPRGMFDKVALSTAKREMRDGEPMDCDRLIDLVMVQIPRGDTSKRDTRRQRTSRAIQKLCVDKVLHKHGDNMVSLTAAQPQDEDWDDE